MNNDKLLPCPFCGGDCCEMQYPQVTKNYKTETKYSAGCPDCGIWTDYCDAEEQAAEAWNRRVDRWIPVTGRMPKVGDTVLAYIRHDREVFGGRDDGFRAYRVYEYDGHFVGMGTLCEATHWTELPEPPGGEE